MIEEIPAVSGLEEGQTYHRVKLHEKHGGTRYRGIAPSTDSPCVFIFTGDAGEEHGYMDEFRGDTFIYTGEGREGDMEMTQGNKAIRDHRADGRQIHLFESNDEAWNVTYVGQFEYADWFSRRLEDTTGTTRDAICFELEPVDNEIHIDDLEEVDLETLYERASDTTATEHTATQTTYTRSEAVKAYARRRADGVCQGCEDPAPFRDTDGDPFLEVHHLTRRSDGGPDHPDNVVALCPNCHRRVHHGRDGDEFNQALLENQNSVVMREIHVDTAAIRRPACRNCRGDDPCPA